MLLRACCQLISQAERELNPAEISNKNKTSEPRPEKPAGLVNGLTKCFLSYIPVTNFDVVSGLKGRK